MEMETFALTQRLYGLAAGVAGTLLVMVVLPDLVSGLVGRLRRMIKGLLPGRRLRKLSGKVESLTRQADRMNAEMQAVRRLLVNVLDERKEKVATPLENGAATPK